MTRRNLMSSKEQRDLDRVEHGNGKGTALDLLAHRAAADTRAAVDAHPSPDGPRVAATGIEAASSLAAYAQEIRDK